VNVIDNFYLFRQPKIIFQISPEQENDKDLEHEEATAQQEKQKNNNTSSIPSSQRAGPSRKRKEDEDRNLNAAFELLKSCTSTAQNNDECQQFGNLVATKLRKFDDMSRSLLQNEIFGIFLRAERALYNQPWYVPGLNIRTQPLGQNVPLQTTHSPASYNPLNAHQAQVYSQSPTPSESPFSTAEPSPASISPVATTSITHTSLPDLSSDDEFTLQELI
jgi:hypothetical protein